MSAPGSAAPGSGGSQRRPRQQLQEEQDAVKREKKRVTVFSKHW